MSQGKFPRAYLSDVPNEGTDAKMKTVPFDETSIGARKSGMPKGGSNSDEMNIDHVGGTAGKGG